MDCISNYLLQHQQTILFNSPEQIDAEVECLSHAIHMSLKNADNHDRLPLKEVSSVE